jgi:hypothetical protein
MVNGAHVILYSGDAEADRKFLTETFGFEHVDAGQGWLIFALPPTELAVHPTDAEPKHEFYLMCDDIEQTMNQPGIEAARPVVDAGWGLLGAIRMPSGAELPIYQPRHPVAHGGRAD